MKLVERVFGCCGARGPRKCVRWDVIFTGAINDVKTVAREFKSPTQESLVLYLSFVTLVKHVGH